MPIQCQKITKKEKIIHINIDIKFQEENKMVKNIFVKGEYKVYAAREREVSKQRLSVKVFVETPEGDLSEIVTVPRRAVYKRKNWCDFMLDMAGDFDEEDILVIQDEIRTVIEGKENEEIGQKRATFMEVYQALSDYLRNVESELVLKNKGDECAVKRGIFEAFIRENRELKYNVDELLEILKYRGYLVVGKNRPYDNQITVNGKKERCYIVKLAEEKAKAEEEIFEETIYEMEAA